MFSVRTITAAALAAALAIPALVSARPSSVRLSHLAATSTARARVKSSASSGKQTAATPKLTASKKHATKKHAAKKLSTKKPATKKLTTKPAAPKATKASTTNSPAAKSVTLKKSAARTSTLLR